MRISPLFFLSLVCLVSIVDSVKFLCYSPRFASSHANFMGKLADSLIDASHEVVVFSPTLDSTVSEGTKRARLIQIPMTEASIEFESGNLTEWHGSSQGKYTRTTTFSATNPCLPTVLH